MRTIRKGRPPEALIRWKADNAATPQNLYYGSGSFPSEAVRQSLLLEQFHLCAYTLRRLKTVAQCQVDLQDTGASCHIEHFLPQSRGVQGEDIDYQNLLACYPPSQSQMACAYGAHAKADTDPLVANVLSPLQARVEAQFSFDERGTVEGKTVDARSTIDVLNLNHPALVQDRASVIRGALNPQRGRKLSAKAARTLAQHVLQPDAQNCLTAFCVAVAQAAEKYAEREERRAGRMKKRKDA